jgi:hypothetical protein
MLVHSQARGAPRLAGIFSAGIRFRSPFAAGGSAGKARKEGFAGGGPAPAGGAVCRIVGGGRLSVGEPRDAVEALAASGFPASLDSVNLSARRARDADDYARRYAAALADAGPDDVVALREAGMVLDRVFGETSDPVVRLAATGTDVRVVLSAGRDAEGGMAHTLGSVIVIPRSELARSSTDLAALLAHELVHVSQRTNMKIHSGRAKAMGWASRDIPAASADPPTPLPARANPDTSPEGEGAVLAARPGGELCGAFFARGAEASDLREVQLACLKPVDGADGGARYSASAAEHEHPNEETAYLVQEAVRRHANSLEAADPGR